MQLHQPQHPQPSNAPRQAPPHVVHPASIAVLASPRPDLLAFAASGTVREADYARVAEPLVQEALRRHDRLDLLLDASGLERVVLGGAVRVNVEPLLVALRRVALVGGSGARFFAPAMEAYGAECRAFETEGEARAWLGAP